MKVLWITNTIFPDLSNVLGNNIPVIGGWMYGLAKDLVLNGINLTVATSRPNMEPYEDDINGIKYFLLKSKKPSTECDHYLGPQWEKVISVLNPDIIHIHGTEYAHGLSLINSCPNQKYVVSIQGLISVYSRYFLGQISIKEIKKNKTLRDFIKNDSLLQAQKKFKNRGQNVEKKYFSLSENFIGRTQWDYDHTKTLNSSISYHFCNESLRDSFYKSKKWDIKTKNNFTIFLSQASYPIKGFHQVIKAINLIKNDFPEIKIRVAGDNILNNHSIKDKIRLGGYAKYIISLLNKFDLHDKIEFTGFLDEEQMIEEYRNCHVFICPSSIENSPNSLGEAQILGTPCIASYVGGVANMVEHEETGLLYRFEEIEMLAQAIKRIFTDKALAKKLSKNGKVEATKRHNRQTNTDRTIEIYSQIISTPY